MSAARSTSEMHQSVGNDVPGAPIARGIELPSEPPSAGDNGEPAPSTRDGIEAVGDYRLPTRERPGVVVIPPNLPDIAEASFGPLKRSRSVFLPDDRVQIQNTAMYPFSAIACLLITARNDQQYLGTGWFIGPKTLATAGHNVFIRGAEDPAANGWVKSVTVIPGRNGALQPFGSATTWKVRSVRGWTENGDENLDYGAILLDTPLGQRTGWFGFSVVSDADLLATTANLSGYPGDKPPGTNWFHARPVQSVNARKVYYDADSFRGQSGSPVWRHVNGARTGIAVHAYGGTSSNSGTRITQDVYSNLLAWKNS